MTDDVFVEVEASQRNRFGEDICGDAFKTMKLADEGRIIAVLSDGLGHGVKASILSLMTATMALRYTANDTDIVRSAEVIMTKLGWPVAQPRLTSRPSASIRMELPEAMTDADHGAGEIEQAFFEHLQSGDVEVDRKSVV